MSDPATVCDACGGYGLLYERGLAHELSEAKAEVEQLTEHIKERERVWSERERVALKEAKRLEVEVERLREALSECLEYLEPSFFEEEALVAGVVKRARAALAGEAQDGE